MTTTVSNFNANIFKSAIFNTLPPENGYEFIHGQISVSTRTSCFKLMCIVSLFRRKSSHLITTIVFSAAPRIASCETTSIFVLVLADTSFEQNNNCFLHALHEALDAFNIFLHDFGFTQVHEQDNPSRSPTHLLPHHPFYSKQSTFNMLHDVFTSTVHGDFSSDALDDFTSATDDFTSATHNFLQQVTSLLVLTANRRSLAVILITLLQRYSHSPSLPFFFLIPLLLLSHVNGAKPSLISNCFSTMSKVFQTVLNFIFICVSPIFICNIL